jgi:hypothetical protein
MCSKIGKELKTSPLPPFLFGITLLKPYIG